MRDRPGFLQGCAGCELLADDQLWQTGMAAEVYTSIVAAHLGEHVGTAPPFEPLDDVRQPHAFRHPEHCSACLAFRAYRRDARTWDGSW